ncbi:hypothetical protein LWI29_038374 [Acer saccharum]|uniref:Plant disease resistance WDH domain-containing protein n=1 Tax=Acer saccharum TaxID=4024 RepID=A0AA39S3N9_ACESA|nr:hypothetical protein LWI29_038374 [Acer saccharum]
MRIRMMGGGHTSQIRLRRWKKCLKLTFGCCLGCGLAPQSEEESALLLVKLGLAQRANTQVGCWLLKLTIQGIRNIEIKEAEPSRRVAVVTPSLRFASPSSHHPFGSGLSSSSSASSSCCLSTTSFHVAVVDGAFDSSSMWKEEMAMTTAYAASVTAA